MHHTEAKKLYIPDNIKVGYQDREGTYTGKLAYVVYYDHKKVLRKESSWNSWRDHKIDPSDFANTPTEGFVLNKGVGGTRESYGWNARNEYIRVYDPRNFEFEISVANLLFILQETSCSPGKGLEGQFVYAWDKADLVLLPVKSQDYKSCQEFTNLQASKIGMRDLKLGATYRTKSQVDLVYLGKFDYYYSCERYWSNDNKGHCKILLFRDVKNSKFVHLKTPQSLAVKLDEDINSNYSLWVDEFNTSPHASYVTRLFLKEEQIQDQKTSFFHHDEKNNVFHEYTPHEIYVDSRGNESNYSYPGHNTFKCIRYSPAHTYYLENNILKITNNWFYDQWEKERSQYNQPFNRREFVRKEYYFESLPAKTGTKLFAELSNGKVFTVTRYQGWNQKGNFSKEF